MTFFFILFLIWKVRHKKKQTYRIELHGGWLRDGVREPLEPDQSLSVVAGGDGRWGERPRSPTHYCTDAEVIIFPSFRSGQIIHVDSLMCRSRL